jgi:H+-translocating NAD(P) transhydrogenase subunit alpha
LERYTSITYAFNGGDQCHLRHLQTEVIGGDEITLTSIIGAVAVFLASINIFGGFMVTRRMLEMFKKKAPKADAAGTK